MIRVTSYEKTLWFSGDLVETSTLARETLTWKPRDASACLIPEPFVCSDGYCTARETNPTERMRLFRKELKIERCVIYLRIGISIGRFGRVLPLSEFGLRCMRWNGAARIWDVATA